MIKEDYVSFEVARLLEEKGFNEVVHAYYNIFDKVNLDFNVSGRAPHLQIPCPTHQMAMAWLREVHKIFIVIQPVSGKGYGAVLCDVGDFDDFNYIGETDYFFHPEEAVEAALKYVLENLI